MKNLHGTQFLPSLQRLRRFRPLALGAAALLALGLAGCATQPGGAQSGPISDPDAAFNPANFQRMVIDSSACTGFYRTPDFKCWPVKVPVYLVRPKSGDTKALVFISPGSQGIDRRHGDYAQHLADNGINAMVVDHWAARGIKNIQFDYEEGRDRGGDSVNQSVDVLTLTARLKATPEWRNTKFGQMGESIGGSTAVNITRPYIGSIVNEQTRLDAPLMDAAVGLYAGCMDQDPREFFKPVPLLLISAEKDEITPAKGCAQQVDWMKKHGGTPEPIVILPGEYHDFDATWMLWTNSRAKSMGNCRSYLTDNERVLVSTGQKFPLTHDGYRAMRVACTTTGTTSGRLTADRRVGYPIWTAFFQRKLLNSGS